MGESFINQGINSNGAIIRVIANNNSVITCTDGKSIYKKKCIDNIVEFKVGYGNWTITSIIDNKNYEKTVNIKTLKKYEVSLASCTYGIRIDMNNGNPATAVTYIDDAVGFTPLVVNLNTGICNYGSWEDIILNDIGCRPCLLNTNEKSKKYLNPNDYSKFEDGTPADITSGTSGNVMVEFKKTWYKYSVDGNILTFQVANYDRTDDGFVCSAFKSMDGSGKVKDYMYYGAYEGHIDNPYDENAPLRSLSNKPATSGGINISAYRRRTQNNGPSYGLEDWCKRCYLLGLLMLVTKTRDIQSAIGYGNANDGNTMDIESGTLDQAGLFAGYGIIGGVYGKSVKAFGIENLWGNCSNYCDGVIITDTAIYIKDSAPYDNNIYDLSGYTYISQAYDTKGIPISMITIGNGSCIFPKIDTLQSDTTKGWCDELRFADIISENMWNIIICGGDYYDSGDTVGPFYIRSVIDKYQRYPTACRFVYT